MLWNAVSTFVESRAEVSINESWLDSAKDLASSVGTALKWRKSDLLPTEKQAKDEIQRPKFNLVALTQHDHDVGIGMVAQLTEPSLHIFISQMFGDVVD